MHLLDGQTFSGLPAENLRKLALGCLGGAARVMAEHQTIAFNRPANLNSVAGSEWYRALAEETLLAMQFAPDFSTDPRVAGMLAISPFSDGPALRDLCGLRAVVAVVPLDTTDGRSDHSEIGKPGAWLHLWLVEDIDSKLTGSHERRLEGAETWVARHHGLKLFLITEDRVSAQISGPSWRLAAELALRVLRDSPARFGELARSLATQWIVTGDVQEADRVGVVRIGNKIRLRTGRSWMFPPDNRRDVLGYGSQLGMVRFPASVNTALALLTGLGVAAGGDLRWADIRPVVLHTFTSGTWKPIVQALLLAAPPQLKIWHSDDPKISIPPARALEGALAPGFWTDHPPLVRESTEISSTDLDVAEGQIRSELERDLADGRLVLFNITQGNRMMGLAPHSLAQVHPNLWLIYRDAAGPRYQFTVIRYEGVLPTTQKLVGAGGLAEDVPATCWDAMEDVAPLVSTAEAVSATLGGRAFGKKVRFPSELPPPAVF